MYEAGLTVRDFTRLGEFIHETWGIKMPPTKKGMLEGRLAKRLRCLGLGSFREYCDYLFSPEGSSCELIHLIDVVSTNKTGFFREAESFTYLCQKALPDLVESKLIGPARRLIVWCAGCSSGEEPFTLAMLLSDFRRTLPELELDFRVLATDVSISALDKGLRAVYNDNDIKPIPTEMRRKYLLKSKDRRRRLFRFRPSLRSRIFFHHLNLMDDFTISHQLQVIFCRNVIIYFERQTQEKLFNKLCQRLVRGGYIFIGHSESLHGMDLPLKQLAPTIYRKE